MERITNELNNLEHLNYVNWILFFLSITQLFEANNCINPLALEIRILPVRSQKSYSDSIIFLILLTVFSTCYHKLFNFI